MAVDIRSHPLPIWSYDADGASNWRSLAGGPTIFYIIYIIYNMFECSFWTDQQIGVRRSEQIRVAWTKLWASTTTAAV